MNKMEGDLSLNSGTVSLGGRGHQLCRCHSCGEVGGKQWSQSEDDGGNPLCQPRGAASSWD